MEGSLMFMYLAQLRSEITFISFELQCDKRQKLGPPPSIYYMSNRSQAALEKHCTTVHSAFMHDLFQR